MGMNKRLQEEVLSPKRRSLAAPHLWHVHYCVVQIRIARAAEIGEERGSRMFMIHSSDLHA